MLALRSRPGGGEDAGEAMKIARDIGASWIVADGYHFGEVFQDAVKRGGARLMMIDDWGHCGRYPADIVLNQNLHARSCLYPGVSANTKLLLGSRYLLLRREFRGHNRSGRRFDAAARRVLVTMGGSDPSNTALKVLKALRPVVGRMEMRIVAGGASQCASALREIALKEKNVEILENVSDMPQLMSWADIAFSSGGTSSWEMAYMGLPGIVIYCADNQRPVAEELDRHGVALDLGHVDSIGEKDILSAYERLSDACEIRRSMSEKGMGLIDGDGAGRVVDEMCFPFLRRAAEGDCRFAWELSNDPDVRRSSFSPAEIPWEDHAGWFGRTLSDPSSFFYMIEDFAGRRAGQVRFKSDGESATISISLSRDFRGGGRGGKAISLASEVFFRESGLSVVNAYIKSDNAASARAFRSAGFNDAPSDSFSEERGCVRMVRERP